MAGLLLQCFCSSLVQRWSVSRACETLAKLPFSGNHKSKAAGEPRLPFGRTLALGLLSKHTVVENHLLDSRATLQCVGQQKVKVGEEFYKVLILGNFVSLGVCQQQVVAGRSSSWRHLLV